MQIITSPQNLKITETAKLKDAKYRKQSGKFIVEGEKMVLEAIDRGVSISSIFVTDESVLNGYDNENVYLVTERAFNKIADTVTPQKAIAVINKEPYEMGELKRAIILDGIQDPGNMGTILRTAAATGTEHVFITDDCTDPYSPKAVRSSMGGIYCIKTFQMQRNQIITLMREKSIPIVVADMGGKDVFSVSLDSFSLVVGNEAHGVSNEFKAAKDFAVSLKMQNIESLNAAVALSVILYKLTN